MNIGGLSIDFIIHLVLWILGFLFLFRISSCGRAINRNTSYPSISVIIPSRNEEHTLPNLLQSLEDQLSPEDEVIVVDDHSEDRTKAVAEKSGVIVLESLPTPIGWIGKTWACFQGANLPCIISQRYNRVKLVRVLSKWTTLRGERSD